MVLLQHVCVLTWSITARVCAGYGFVAARVCADVVNYSMCVYCRGQLQHVCVLSWSITVRVCTVVVNYSTWVCY